MLSIERPHKVKYESKVRLRIRAGGHQSWLTEPDNRTVGLT